MKKVELTVDGMMCGMCEAHIKDAIRKRIPEARHLKADHVNGTASFVLEENMPESMLSHEIASELKPMGYELLDLTTSDLEDKPRKGLFARFRK